MPGWADHFKLFTYAFTKDPLSKKVDTRDLSGAGISQPEAIFNLGPDGSWSGGDQRTIRYRESNDFIDLSTVSNRPSRYKEYERLRNVAEIEMAMTVFADEACVAGDTKVATPFGFQTIEWLAKNRAGERFLVYCYDFAKQDYTLGWAFSPRLVRHASTIKVSLDDGSEFVVTPDHRMLLRSGKWLAAGELKFGDELMPFYRLKANQNFTNLKTNQYPRIFTFDRGWIHERQFVEEWKLGKPLEKYEKYNKAVRLLSSSLNMYQVEKLVGHDWLAVKNWLKKEGFSYKEVRHLNKFYPDRRRVVCVEPWKEIDVYDLSVEQHENFCSDSVVFHNCQKDENGHVFKIECKSQAVVEELEFLFYHRMMLNMDRRIWSDFKNLCIFGDLFWELVINPQSPSDGVLKLTRLPAESIYRIETTKGKVVEFQQSKEGPDYQALTRAPVVRATDSEIQQATALRFTPEQIVHMRIGDDRKTFYPYGVSLIEAARGPAHQLRLMEDAMVVYRLTRAPERRVFYIDVGQLPPFKAEAFIERMKDQFRKKKVASNRGLPGANQVDEKFTPPAADEDYWLPIRPNSNTKIETLPGAQNLGEIDDAIYFRNKLFTALNFPKSYFSNEDPNATRITLSAQDVKFARMIERLQAHFEDGLWEVADRHLQLRGFPQEAYDDLRIRMTAPSDWRELSRAEVTTNRITNAGSLKGSLLLADYDILTKWMKYSEDETQEMLARLKIQKLEELKMQILAQNPQLVGAGIPGQGGEQEIGAEAGGPTPMLGGMPDQQQQMPPDQMPMPPDQMQMPPEAGPSGTPGPAPAEGPPLTDPEDEDIKRYDLEIQDYESEQDMEDIDYSTGG